MTFGQWALNRYGSGWGVKMRQEFGSDPAVLRRFFEIGWMEARGGECPNCDGTGEVRSVAIEDGTVKGIVSPCGVCCMPPFIPKGQL